MASVNLNLMFVQVEKRKLNTHTHTHTHTHTLGRFSKLPDSDNMKSQLTAQPTHCRDYRV